MKHIHLIGIGGTGLSAIAKLLKESGYLVSGSDQVISPLADALMKMGIQVFEGHRAENITGADTIVQSSAVAPENPEILAARAAGIPVYKRSEFLGSLLAGKIGIGVAGTHGKTTTTSMIAWMLTALGRDPSYIVGGVIKGLESNAHAGSGDEFVIEADEYDRMFHGLHPQIAIITNMEHDHPDCYPTPQDYHAAFLQYAQSVKVGGVLLVCADDPAVLSLVKDLPASLTNVSYGLQSGSNYYAENIHLVDGYFHFEMMKNFLGKKEILAKDVHLIPPGQHNVQNAVATLAVADLLNLDLSEAAAALATYPGSGRRFEVVDVVAGITLIDDYAHHPTEIAATLSAARSRFANNRIWAVWQPHTYSRTKLLEDAFATSFDKADQVIVTEIYASREKNQAYSSARVVDLIPDKKAMYLRTLQETTEYLLTHLQSGDTLVVLSAGDADQINRQLRQQLSERTH